MAPRWTAPASAKDPAAPKCSLCRRSSLVSAESAPASSGANSAEFTWHSARSSSRSAGSAPRRSALASAAQPLEPKAALRERVRQVTCGSTCGGSASSSALVTAQLSSDSAASLGIAPRAIAAASAAQPAAPNLSLLLRSSLARVSAASLKSTRASHPVSMRESESDAKHSQRASVCTNSSHSRTLHASSRNSITVSCSRSRGPAARA
mmetsp:Transcript_60259/g.142219  ORF Transcript_60259/g.142219 Transcript_60259/m.142219 type:complete len:208 (-) Transcript_60259:143-766(-)